MKNSYEISVLQLPSRVCVLNECTACVLNWGYVLCTLLKEISHHVCFDTCSLKCWTHMTTNYTQNRLNTAMIHICDPCWQNESECTRTTFKLQAKQDKSAPCAYRQRQRITVFLKKNTSWQVFKHYLLCLEWTFGLLFGKSIWCVYLD